MLLALLPGCGRRDTAREERAVQHAVKALQSRTVTKLDILYYNKDALTRASITPKHLEERYQRKLTVEKFQGSDWQRDLVRALQARDMKRASFDYPDCRWACIFYDAKQARVLTMYFDGHGWRGLIGGTPVEVQQSPGKLKVVSLLEKRCLPRWE